MIAREGVSEPLNVCSDERWLQSCTHNINMIRNYHIRAAPPPPTLFPVEISSALVQERLYALLSRARHGRVRHD
jgi:hypothetical protein